MSDWSGFDPVPDADKAAPVLRVVVDWHGRVLLPVPEDAPPPPTKHPRLGAPPRRWEYRDAGGRLLGLCLPLASAKRPGDIKEPKESAPLSLPNMKKFGRRWRWQGFSKPRPLYGLDRLAARPAAPVVLCEGEKSADAAGGAVAWSRRDRLAGRQ